MKLIGLSERARAQLSKAFAGALDGRLLGSRLSPEGAQSSKRRLHRVLRSDRELLDENGEGRIDPSAVVAEDAIELEQDIRADDAEGAEAADESKRRLLRCLQRDRELLAKQSEPFDDEIAKLRVSTTDVLAAPASPPVRSAGLPAGVAPLSAATMHDVVQQLTAAEAPVVAALKLEAAVLELTKKAAASAADDLEACSEPICTRSMARLLASQGHHQRALAIYRELLRTGDGDDGLRAEADALRSAH